MPALLPQPATPATLFAAFEVDRRAAIEITERYQHTGADDPLRPALFAAMTEATERAALSLERWLQAERSAAASSDQTDESRALHRLLQTEVLP